MKNFLPSMVYEVLLTNLFMRKLSFLFVFFLSSVLNSHAQYDPQLVERVKNVLKYTQEKNLEKIMDYTYPKIFTIISRDQLIEAMKSIYETDEFITTLDSIALDTIFPVFKINDAQYVKIRHTMLMKMRFKEPFDTADAESNNTMIKLMEEQFGKGKVRLDKLTSTIIVSMRPDLVGIKDELAKEWCFVNLDEDNALVNMILNKEVIAKLKEFK